jgi:hypothetical protein
MAAEFGSAFIGSSVLLRITDSMYVEDELCTDPFLLVRT